MSGLLRLPSSAEHIVFKIHSRHSRYQHFAPFYCWIIIHPMTIPHLFIHSPVNQLLGGFQAGAGINNATITIHMWVHVELLG